MRRMWSAWGAVLALLGGGCDAIDLSGVTQRNAKTRVRPEPPGEHCRFGGQAVQSGLDLDRDGLLDDAEVTATDYICAAALPEVSTRTRPEPHGANCALGGQAIQSGLDLDANGQLDDAEVTATDYVCATTVANVLLRVRPVSPGAQCALGGQVTHAGHDANANGLLEDEEVSREVLACDEPASVLSRMRSIPAFTAPCDGDENGGSAVEAGVDLNGDTALEPSEVEATGYACGIEPSELKARHQTEPAGSHCARGGTRVDFFQDSNHDGTPDPGGFTSTVYVCHSIRVHDGMFVVTSPVDLVALEGVTHLRGELRISAPTLTDASLPALSVIQGALTVVANSSLRRLSLPALRFVGGDVAVRSNARLDSLTLGTAASAPLWVERSLLVEDNPLLPTLEGLAAVQPRDSITLRANDSLVEPGQLSFVTVLQGSVLFQDNLQVKRTPFVHLTRVHGDVRITNNSLLTAPFGLEQLTSVDGTLELKNNALLEQLAPLGQLTSVGQLELIGNPRLENTVGLDKLTFAGSIHLQGNTGLLSAGDMPLLQRVDEGFFVRFNAQLQRVHRLPQLRGTGAVTLTVNDALTSLEGFSRVTWLHTLEVLGNKQLATLGDLSALRELRFLNLQGNPALTGFNLGELARVTDDFVVVDNAKLPTCLATALAANVFQGDPLGGVHIFNNDDATPCP
ncbi:DUF7151 family protein [Corallococcus silvisoli]|uniref:DUF7151 family protein n=1 Tax=Corallococcus silvisoli TaxID=2697031 RepID=UPI001376F4F8|nr:hypothetical protein [Corallococcus silvisoli]NBD07438.1 hypothetical protein [Corallococcus silvisoli]